MLTHQVVCPVMVGRQAELDALVALVERAAGERRGRTVFVTGDAGVGKSRLCRELKQHAVARGVRALEGRCTSADSSPPYGPFLDALRFRLAKGEADVAARVLGPVASHLAPLLPELRPPGAPAESARDALPAPSERVFEAVAKVFERLAELGPILLILEDFQFADSTSRELLRFIARRVQTLPVVIVATCRSDELPPRHPVRRLIAGLTGERLAREIALRPLDERGVADMLAAIVGSVPSPELIRVVYRRSEGNPFFVEELLHALADTPQFMPDAGDVERASPPATIHEMVLGRLEPLGAGVVNVLSVAAVIGRRFDFDPCPSH